MCAGACDGVHALDVDTEGVINSENVEGLVENGFLPSDLPIPDVDDSMVRIATIIQTISQCKIV